MRPDFFSSTRPLVMGIINVTPDSFSDGGLFTTADDAVACALKMVEDGADIIDIGGESTRPDAMPVGEEEELKRVMPVIDQLARSVTVPLSIDTTKARVAREALDAGASIVNDVSALRFDAAMAKLVAQNGAFVILMHMQGTPGTMQKKPSYRNVVEEVFSFLDERIRSAESFGIPKDRIVIDPGIGFGKTVEHNLSLLKHIARFHDLGCPMMVGVSRKSLIGAVTGMPVNARLFGTASIVAHCVMEGIQVHRVHDVREMRQVCDMAVAIRDSV
ncbi:dihydropteroate synthase [Candidatus Latescibacterota bacterium]